MPNTGMFHLFEIRCGPQRDCPDAITSIAFVRAQCCRCRGLFDASEPPSLHNIDGGGAVLMCPACLQRQAISAARFSECVARFPSDHNGTHHSARTGF